MNRLTQIKNNHPKLVMGALVFLVIPLAASLVMGYEMRADVAVTIPTVVLDQDNTEFSRTYLDYVEESEYFQIVDYAETYRQVEQDIYTGKAYAGVIIPEHFYADMLAGKAPKILTIYDGSTMAVIVSSKASMMEILLTVKAGYMAQVYEGKQSVVPGQVMNQVVAVDNATRTLYNPTKSFRNFILPGMLAAVVQLAMAITGAERGFENQQRLRLSGSAQEQRTNFYRHLKCVCGWSLAGVLSLLLTMGTQWLFFGLPLRGSIPALLLLTFVFALDITALGYLMGSIFPERMFCTQISAILVLPTAILGGYTWPVLAMPGPMQGLAKVIPFTYYSDAIRNLCLKPVALSHLVPELLFMIGFFLVMMGLLALILKGKARKAEKFEAGEVAI